MKKIKARSYFAMLISLGLIFGLCVFAARLFSEGRDWVMLRANRNVFNAGVLDTGTVVDRNGVVLASASGGVRSFAGDADVRVACLHAVGDYSGNIGSGALSAFDYKLAGYDPINGVAALSGNGGKLKLSIDSSLNAAACQALNGRRGAVLVSNYRTGEILCMVSLPSYDPASPPDLSQPQYEGVFMNRCLGAAYTPGSVFKLVTLAAAIENVPDLYSRTFTCAGSVTVGGDVVRCTGVHGQQTVEQALANSCNVAFSELSQALGADAVYEYAEKFGLLSSLETSGIATAAGSMEKAGAGTSDLSWMGIGQYQDLVSPIAMLRFVSAIANDGVAKEPVLLRNARSGSERLLEAAAAEKLRAFMSYNVAYAYGPASFPNLKICAKTGTAELGDGTSHAWFVGFLDDSENPLAFTVLIEKGGGALAGAGPVANAVLQAAVGGA
ncbi:MAG: penicillin-binding protein [Oscillospiraceae bacterium]|jgi:peptidoglycan glycosyltransferase|nr:penicillin-binding protein [Oscillospiraceae bacterium]